MKRYNFGVFMGNVGMFEADNGDYVKLADVQASVCTELLQWQPVSAGMPDAETNVLLALADGTTCEGFYDGHWEDIDGQPPLFRDVCADPLDMGVVIAWAEMPGGPARQQSAPATPAACGRNSGCECATAAAQAVCMHRKAAPGVQTAAAPLNGIPANWYHGEGAIARCSYCRRYSLDPKTLGDQQPACECGEKHGWSGSFEKPGPDARWSGKAPIAPTAVFTSGSRDFLGPENGDRRFWPLPGIDRLIP